MDNITKFPPLHILPPKKPPTEPPESPEFLFNQFALNGNSAVMREKMLKDTFVLDNIAILGQATAIYAKPNTGKTLIVLWMLIESIKTGRIKGENVFYINADDTYKGLVTKLEIAEQYGFKMIAPSHSGFETNKFQSYIRQAIDDNTAHGKVIILDTVKKFTDLMDKKQATNFMKIGREFISSGGTLIMMAHTNKNRDTDGKVVFAGTSDVVDDCDCAFILDEVTKTDFNKQVLFENFKSRGDVARELAFTYSIIEKQSYKDLIDSVQLMDVAIIEQVKQEKVVTVKREKDKHAIEAITDAINQGHYKRADLVKFAMDKNNYGVPRQKVWDVLDRYTGEKLSNSSLWRVQIGDKNSKSYYLLSDESIANDYENAKNGY
jgi:hypothetical protein